eukprot:CAMPEP_0184493414 /NCGR_PEP_ID=MMETSP0113_2-20130426/25934_1 /TAXON_ID=91329 /ORGANISM="Norrisiella sphaerica, Strain BC52" /LENGTH=607 /DNA_ID=CAMNT_0026878659 /DNA_START=115 /DNA_END=1938 /DNA_ORIENTATION=-
MSLIKESKDGKLNGVKNLINEGADLDQKDDLGQTPLIWAVRKGHKDIVELLCDSNADVSIESQAGTALEIAEEEGHEEIAQILKDAGAGGGGALEGEDDGDGWGDNDGGGWADEGDGGEEWAGDDGDGGDAMAGEEDDSYVAKIQIFYSADDLKKEDQAKALDLYRQCVSAYEEWKDKSESGQTDEEVDDDTVALALKALVAQVGILLDTGEEKEALETYDHVFNFAKNPSISESDFRTAILGVLNSAVELRQKQSLHSTVSIFSKTLAKLSSLGNQTLWDETSFKLCALYSSEGDLKNAEKVLETVHRKCQVNGEDDLTKPDQLCEIYARMAQIRIDSRSEDDGFLQNIYNKTHVLKSNVMDPKNDSILKECWGKKFGNEGHWEKAYAYFFKAFKNYQTIGHSTNAKRCLQYAVMTNMLCDTTENPFEQQEARVYKTDPQIQAINNLRDAYDKCDVGRFNSSIKSLQPDWYMRKHLNAVVRDFQERAICDTIRPYQRVRIEFLSSNLGVNKESVLDILIQLILDGKINGKINEVEGILDMRKTSRLNSAEKAKYEALSNWVDGLESSRKSIPQPESRRLGSIHSEEFQDITRYNNNFGAGPGKQLF